MFKISCPDGSIIVSSILDYDTYGNQGIDIQLSTSVDVESRLNFLTGQITAMQAEKETEKQLLLSNPGLKELHDKYKVMLGLLNES